MKGRRRRREELLLPSENRPSVSNAISVLVWATTTSQPWLIPVATFTAVEDVDLSCAQKFLCLACPRRWKGPVAIKGKGRSKDPARQWFQSSKVFRLVVQGSVGLGRARWSSATPTDLAADPNIILHIRTDSGPQFLSLIFHRCR